MRTLQRSYRRSLVLAARAAVLLALGAGVTGYGLAERTVTIAADGQVHTLHTFAGDVADALSRAGIAVGAHDVVAPALDAPVHSGSRIVVERGRPLTLDVDGTERTVWVTQGTLGDAADALGLRLEGAYVSASRSRTIPASGLALTVRLPKQVTLVVGGVTSTVTTTEASVAALLTDNGVTLGPFDRVSVPLGAYPDDGMTVVVTREQRTQTLQRTRLPMRTLRVADPHLLVGRTKLAHDGGAGVRYQLWGIVTDDGLVVERKLLEQRVVLGKPKVIHYGTKAKPVVVQAATVPTAVRTSSSTTTTTTSAPRRAVAPRRSSLNWAALAQCESGGDPRLVDGPYYGLYQFTVGTWRSVGGKGLPSDASSAEQTYRAQLLYAQQGRSPWPSCGRYL